MFVDRLSFYCCAHSTPRPVCLWERNLFPKVPKQWWIARVNRRKTSEVSTRMWPVYGWPVRCAEFHTSFWSLYRLPDRNWVTFFTDLMPSISKDTHQWTEPLATGGAQLRRAAVMFLKPVFFAVEQRMDAFSLLVSDTMFSRHAHFYYRKVKVLFCIFDTKKAILFYFVSNLFYFQSCAFIWCSGMNKYCLISVNCCLIYCWKKICTQLTHVHVVFHRLFVLRL